MAWYWQALLWVFLPIPLWLFIGSRRQDKRRSWVWAGAVITLIYVGAVAASDDGEQQPTKDADQVAASVDEEQEQAEQPARAEQPEEAEKPEQAENELSLAEALTAGNVARCNDGAYSDNTDLTATCSSHDGVDRWLADYGECEDGDIVEMDEDACGYGQDLKRLMPAGYTPPTTTTMPMVAAVPETTIAPRPIAPTPTTPPTTPPTAPPTTAPPVTAPPTTRPPVTTPPSQGTVHPGAFCSVEGATGVSKRGVPMVCSYAPGDDRLRWRSA